MELGPNTDNYLSYLLSAMCAKQSTALHPVLYFCWEIWDIIAPVNTNKEDITPSATKLHWLKPKKDP